MSASLLITQCLQNDFVSPIGRYEPIPNLLHVGFSEAQRLMGEDPAYGPVAQAMRWAYAQPDSDLRVIHIRDWHTPSDPAQAQHLEQFGVHCVHDTPGAAFAFEEPEHTDKAIEVVDSLGLNDFCNTRLASVLEPLGDTPRRVGIIGAWTEAKVSFLAYELRTRFPTWDIAICSALTASSTRQNHFGSLDRLQRLFGVQVFSSLGEFADFLAGAAPDAPLPEQDARFPEITGDPVELSPPDLALVRYIFRDCRSLDLKVLGGGFSGNVVLGTTSTDMQGHEQVPHVIKIGPQSEMGKERNAFERVQNVLGNNAPQIADFADYQERGAIKYRYASMGGTFSTTFQKQYMQGLPLEDVQRVVDTVFGEQLMRLYKAASLEECDLLEHYAFSPKWAPSVRSKVEEIVGKPVHGKTLEILPGLSAPNPCDFYEETLTHLPQRAGERFFMSYVHGDLNGANIILDDHSNIWMLDFFHTRRAHVLMDLIKLENDLLFIWTPVDSEDELREACAVTDALLETDDLATNIPEICPSSRPELQRAWATIRMLRSYYPRLVGSARQVLQLQVAQLRYAAHTLGFDECSLLQRKWALYTAAKASGLITEALHLSTRLRVDWIDATWTGSGRVGLTLLPGRLDYERNLAEDLRSLTEDGVKRIVVLVPSVELRDYGVPNLVQEYRDSGFTAYHLPLVDQKASGLEPMQKVLAFIDEGVAAGESVLVHCVGGLGRSGMAVAAWLKTHGASSDEAIAAVREARGSRAVETRVQVEFVRDYPA